MKRLRPILLAIIALACRHSAPPGTPNPTRQEPLVPAGGWRRYLDPEQQVSFYYLRAYSLHLACPTVDSCTLFLAVPRQAPASSDPCPTPDSSISVYIGRDLPEKPSQLVVARIDGSPHRGGILSTAKRMFNPDCSYCCMGDIDVAWITDGSRAAYLECGPACNEEALQVLVRTFRFGDPTFPP